MALAGVAPIVRRFDIEQLPIDNGKADAATVPGARDERRGGKALDLSSPAPASGTGTTRTASSPARRSSPSDPASG